MYWRPGNCWGGVLWRPAGYRWRHHAWHVFSFLTAIIMLYEPMRKLGRVSVLQRSLAAAERVFTVLDTPAEQPEEREKPAPSSDHRPSHHACLHALSPQYLLVLHDILSPSKRVRWWRWWDLVGLGKRRWCISFHASMNQRAVIFVLTA